MAKKIVNNKNNQRIFPIAIIILVLINLINTILVMRWVILSVKEIVSIDYQTEATSIVIRSFTLVFAIIFITCAIVCYWFYINNRNYYNANRKLDFLTNAIPGGVIVINKTQDMNLLYISEGFLNLLGYSIDEIDKFEKEKYSNFIFEEDLNNLPIVTKHHLCNNNDFELQYRLIKKNGELVWIIEKAHLITNRLGEECLYCLCTDIQSLKEQEKQNFIQKQCYEAAIKQMSDLSFEYDYHTACFKLSEESIFTNILKEGKLDIVAFLSMGIIDNEYHEKVQDVYYRLILGTEMSNEEIKYWPTNGSEAKWVSINFTRIVDNQNKPICAIGVIKDITTAKNLETTAIRNQEYRSNMLASSISAYLIDLTNCVVIEAYQEGHLVNLNHNEPFIHFVDRTINNFVHLEDRPMVRSWFEDDFLLNMYKANKSDFEGEYRLRKRDGTYTWLKSNIHIYNDILTDHVYALMYSRDIDREKNRELELTFLAEHDVLTKVFNRLAAKSEIENFLKTPEGTNNSHVFICLDLDGFKEINDQYGHIVGDELLCQVAKVLMSVCRSTDIVARLGGDEFFMFLKNISSFIDVERKISQICRNFNKIIIAPYGNIQMKSCFGATITKPDSTFEVLYHQADMALYEAKSHGDNQWVIYREK